jgi:putative ABC transport system permease protein
MIYLQILKESFLFAFNSLLINKLRTFLSLLGITIGIFAIISVFTVIDSLRDSIKGSIASLGDKVVYVQKWPWAFGGNYPWWKYMNRPVINIRDYEEVKRRSQKCEACSFSISTSKTVQYRNNYIQGVIILSVSPDYEKIWSFDIAEGRYFSSVDHLTGKNSGVIGANVAEKLFPNEDPLGKEIKLRGRKITIIGVFKKQGTDMFGTSPDEYLVIPINFARNLFNIRKENMNPFIMVKAKENVVVDELLDELRNIMRSQRRLKPMEEDNFALNKASLIAKGFDQIFIIIDIAGIIIGGFSILVGGFGIANIMFVSVKEQTQIIGIQKALGAKRKFILLQFLYEAIILSLIGGIIGLVLIYLGTVIVSHTTEMSFSLSTGNIILGLVISISIGIISGFMPAWSASRLDPVVAMSTL